MSTDLIKLDDDYDEYVFTSDEDITISFQKAFKDFKIMHTPYKKNKFIYVCNLLDKFKVNESLPRELYNHFNTNLTNLKKISKNASGVCSRTINFEK